MKNIFAVIMDEIFVGLILGIVAYCWCMYLSKNMILSITMALIGMLTCYLVYYRINKRNKIKNNITKDIQQNLSQIDQKLPYLPPAEQTKWLASQICTTTDISIYTNFFIVDNTVYYNALLLNELNKVNLQNIIRDIVSTINASKIQNIIILCDSYSHDIMQFCKSFNTNIKLLNKVDAIKVFKLKDTNLYPLIYPTTQKKDKLFFIKYALSKQRAKSYALCGLVLIVSSFFVLYKIYYLLFGSLLLLTAMITIVLSIKNKSISA